MNAARLHSYDDDRLQIDDVPETERSAGPTTSSCEVGGAGLCRTDLHIIEGILAETFPDLELPYTLGHENAGLGRRGRLQRDDGAASATR